VLESGLPIAKGLGDKTVEKLAAWAEEQNKGSGGGDEGPERATLAGALLGGGWGTPLEAPAPAAAAAALREAALALPGDHRVLGAAAGDLEALEAFWERISDLEYIPIPPAEPGGGAAAGGPEALLKGKQRGVARRLRGLVALARAVAGSAPPDEVLKVRRGGAPAGNLRIRQPAAASWMPCVGARALLAPAR
jgi:hypothetical protein